MTEREYLELILVLAEGDGQIWDDFWHNPEQQRIGITMYKAQADYLLESDWLARYVPDPPEGNRL